MKVNSVVAQCRGAGSCWTKACCNLTRVSCACSDFAGFVVVHGAGSFGHFEASQYGITKPETPQQTLLEGFAKTRRSVTRLNHLVVSALVDAGIPAVGVSPFGMCYCQNGKLHPDWQQGYVDAVQATLCRYAIGLC